MFGLRFVCAVLVAGLFASMAAWAGAAEAQDKLPVEVVPQIGHTGFVSSVAFSPDGRFALFGCQDKTLKLWDVATGKVVRTFHGHTGDIWSVAFSPGGRFALSGSSDKTLKLWELATGKELRSFIGHKGWVRSVAFSPDARFALSGSDDKTLKLWEVATGKELRSFRGHIGYVLSVAFSPDGRFALSGSYDNTMKLWEVATGRELRSFTGHTLAVNSVAFSPGGRLALSSGEGTLKLWEVATGIELRSFSAHAVSSAAFSPDGRLVLSGAGDGTLKLWDAGTGEELRTFSEHSRVQSVAFSPDGRFLLSGNSDGSLKLWEVATGKALRSFTGHTNSVWSVAFSPDGRFILFSSWDNTLKLSDAATGKELRTFSGHTGNVTSVAFSRDGRFALSGSQDNTIKLWEVATGEELHSFNGHTDDVSSVAFSPDGRFALSGSQDNAIKLWEVATGKELRSFVGHSSFVESVVFSPDGRFALSGSADNTMKLWEVATGKELHSFSGHIGNVQSVAFSPDDRLALSGSVDATTRVWSIEKGQELVRLFSAPEGEWLTLTPTGFFSGSHRDTDMLAIVRGLEVTTIGQVHQSLFNPDLVREALAGDPGGDVRRAANVVNLEKVLDSGPPPIVAIISHSSDSQSAADLVTVHARIADQGKGIGRIEWRVNGITASVTGVPAGAGPDYEVKQTIALDSGENKIEVIAYNARNLLASLPARTTITFTGPADSVKPKLYILAIGINTYVDKGSEDGDYFPPIRLAVADAMAFAAEMKKAGAGLYSETRVTQMLDTDATAAGLDQALQRISAGINPRDTFVLYAAAHGYSESGRFYLIPQDYQGGANAQALASRAIGQDRLQDWIANRIKAKKAIILLDTCESGALVNGTPASEAAVGRLHEATGRPVLTAAASGQSALETDELGHGVFTAALIEALHMGDSNGNGVIEISELAAYVETRVPDLAAHIDDLATKKGAKKRAEPKSTARAAIAMRGFKDDKQSAHFGSTGEDFAVVTRLP